MVLHSPPSQPLESVRPRREGVKPSRLSHTQLRNPPQRQCYQWSPARLIEAALANSEGVLSNTGALVVHTAPYTGRSPNDRFIVDDSPAIHANVDWGEINHPTTEAVFEKVYSKVCDYLAEKTVYVFDGYAGADKAHSLSVRFVNELALQNLFVHQLFIRPKEEDLDDFTPEFTVIAAPGLKLDPASDGTNSEVAVLVDLEKKLVLIAATRYAGEMKKAIFSVMNYLMPAEKVLPMHCSANVGSDGKSALFFGLSGTGKTTLSADPDRYLIGDDEHGWSEAGIFNFEGGCYAKAIKLDKTHEPQIWNAIKFGALVENVMLHPTTRQADYDDATVTENTRVGYPIESIPNAVLDGTGPHPSSIIFLTADAFGVLPPVARLTPEQAEYHFISGYTSKLAGTERGVTVPQAVFSACFGAPFMPRPPAVYAKLLHDRIRDHKAEVYLVNTGWQGGPYGVGIRISIPHTRAIITAALTGELAKVPYRHDALLNLAIPESCPGVPSELLNPRAQWKEAEAYDKTARELASRFVENFTQFDKVEHLKAAGPQLN